MVTNLREYASHPVHPIVESPPPSTQAEMDAAIVRLRERARGFAQLSIDRRIDLARTMQAGYLRVVRRAVIAGCKAKGLATGTPAEAEEWATGPWGVVRQLRLVCESLRAIKLHGNTAIGPVGETAGGRLSIRVFPGNAIDRMLFKDVTVDVHMQTGLDRESLDATRAAFYKEPHDGRVVLVLGAGNIAAIPPMDVITKMFNEGKVCLLKMSPVNAYLGPFLEEAFAEAIQSGFLALLYGGGEQGHYLVYHRDVDEVHITGSDKTHDQIVWGPPGAERDARMERHEPLLMKPISSELGNISPVIVVPGPYSDKELQFQAEDAASYFVMNASFLCNAAKVLVLPQGWGGSDTYEQSIERICATLPLRLGYYPGASDRMHSLTTNHAGVKQIGGATGEALPWTFIRGIDPHASNEPLFTEEPFCSVLSETRVGSADPVAFLKEAVAFANDKLWGTLSATLVVHPKSMQDPAIRKAVEQAIAELRYGTIAVNGYSGLSFMFAAPPWGAYPGSRLTDIQSGRGFVHNTAMLEGVEKVVMRCPLTTFPKPGYFPTHRTTHKVLPNIVSMEEHASWSRVPGIVVTAMRG